MPNKPIYFFDKNCVSCLVIRLDKTLFFQIILLKNFGYFPKNSYIWTNTQFFVFFIQKYIKCKRLDQMSLSQ